MRDLRTEAAARVLALTHGTLSVEDVTAWADAKIQNEPDFDSRLIDVSMAKTDGEILSALNLFEPAPDKARIAALTFRFFHNALVSGNGDHRKIADALYEMVMKGYIPTPDLEGPMWSFLGQFDLAAAGISGDVKIVKAELVKFLDGAVS